MSGVSQVLLQEYAQADKAFQKDKFENYLKLFDIKIRPVPPRTDNKNPPEPKHKDVCSIFSRLKTSRPECDTDILGKQAIRISKDLYGPDVMTLFDLAKSIRNLIDTTQGIQLIIDEIISAHNELSAKIKLTKKLRSHRIQEINVKSGDMVRIYIRRQNDNSGKCSSPKIVLSNNLDSRTVTVLGKSGKVVSAAILDTRHAMSSDTFANDIQNATDNLNISN